MFLPILCFIGVIIQFQIEIEFAGKFENFEKVNSNYYKRNLMKKINTALWVPIVVVGVNNSFQRILLHKSTILVPTIVSDIKKLYQLRFWAIFERFLGDFAYFVIFQSI